MGVFAANTIYDHMRNQHGTIHGDDPVDNQANVREEVLRQACIFENEAFQEWQRRNELIMAAGMYGATVRRDAAAARRQEGTTRVIVDEPTQWLQLYHEFMCQRHLEGRVAPPREMARAQEERPGCGCTIM